MNKETLPTKLTSNVTRSYKSHCRRNYLYISKIYCLPIESSVCRSLGISSCSTVISITCDHESITCDYVVLRAVARPIIWGWGGGGIYSYIRVLPDGFLLKAIVFTVCEHEYMNIPPPPPPPNHRV